MPLAYRRLIRHGIRRGLPSQAGFSRRDFLKRAAFGAAAIAIAPGFIACRSRGQVASLNRAVGTRVIVVGAGFAGLAAADALMREGADVTVLEAGSRVGGRVQTNRRFIGGDKVEMGGEFIGENHPTWLAMAERFGLELEELAEWEADSPLILGGELVPTETADALYEEIDAALARLIEMAGPIDAERPWRSPNATQLDRTALATFIAESGMSDRAKHLMTLTEEADNGVTADRMSLLAYLAMVKGGGLKDYYELSESYRIRGGNDALATALARALGDRIVLSTPVTRIERTASRVTATAGGREHVADAVVLAVPPTQWRKIEMRLPFAGSPQMGSNVKCILRLREPAWESAELSPEALSDGLAQLGWMPTEKARRNRTGFTMFSGGSTAERWRALPTDERAAAAIASLAPAYAALGDAAEASMFVDWPGLSLFEGSYTFPAPGQITAMGPTLVEGMDDGNAPLLFAGEHTSYAFTGYMEGALASGIRVAERLASIAVRA